MLRRQVGDRAGTRSTDVLEHDLDAEITTHLAVIEHRDRPRHLRSIRIVVDMVVPPLGCEHPHASKSLSNGPDVRQRSLPAGEGDFPGGVVDLRYRFVLDRGLIAELEIAP